MIAESYSSFVNCAKCIPGFIVGQKEDVPYDITDLANRFCSAQDSKDIDKMNQYISALFVRYWHVVVMMYNKSKASRLDFDDIVCWVYEAFEKACKYRSWLDPNKSVSKDPRGAEKCINQCITSVRQYWYANFNKDKRKINFLTSSLDEIASPDEEGMYETILDFTEDTSDTTSTLDSKYLIQSFIDDEDIVSAIILDGIINQDSFLETAKSESIVCEDGTSADIIHCASTFSRVKLAHHLRSLDSNFINYFTSTYVVNDLDKFNSIIELFSTCTKQKLSSVVKRCFEKLRNDKRVCDTVCFQSC